MNEQERDPAPEQREAEGSLDQLRVQEETDAAAAEAGEIGGEGGAEGVPEPDRPRAESGGGEAEGFEQSEEQLVENASHAEPGPDPTAMAGEPEAEEPPTEYGQPDEERVSELDPSERTD